MMNGMDTMAETQLDKGWMANSSTTRTSTHTHTHNHHRLDHVEQMQTSTHGIEEAVQDLQRSLPQSSSTSSSSSSLNPRQRVSNFCPVRPQLADCRFLQEGLASIDGPISVNISIPTRTVVLQAGGDVRRLPESQFTIGAIGRLCATYPSPCKSIGTMSLFLMLQQRCLFPFLKLCREITNTEPRLA